MEGQPEAHEDHGDHIPMMQSPQLIFDEDDSKSPAAEQITPLATHLSDPRDNERRYTSPLRHHKRTASSHQAVKETLDARSEFANEDPDGRVHHRVNQYMLLNEIGRGSYGAVHLGIDQNGKKIAIKVFSKVRLRKRAQTTLLRQGPRRAPNGPGWNPSRGVRERESEDSLFLIRQEVAIMKKLNHPNVVQLIEVLDDPEEDSLYMVMEMCEKGVAMNVGLDKKAEPYPEEQCRVWFRDLILGIEYLHAQGVIHRDIKPDNLLLSDDGVLKVVDFGVSEMFQKPDAMKTAKSAGSPAFLPPELCGKHGEIMGSAADIWSMGVSLFCLRFGRIPFHRDGVLEIYEAIKTEKPQIPQGESPEFVDLMQRVLEKDPEKRIKMPELREHPWVTKNGSDPLLSAEINCSHIVEPPNELELARAFTRKMNHLLCVMKSIRRFKVLLLRIRSNSDVSLTGNPVKSDGKDAVSDKGLGVDIETLLAQRRDVLRWNDNYGAADQDDSSRAAVLGQADREPLHLGIGLGFRDEAAADADSPTVVADSPSAVDFNVYDRAYEEAIQKRVKGGTGHPPTMYLTKFVKDKGHFQKMTNLIEGSDVPKILRNVTDAAKEELSSKGRMAHTLSNLKISGSTKGAE